MTFQTLKGSLQTPWTPRKGNAWNFVSNPQRIATNLHFFVVRLNEYTGFKPSKDRYKPKARFNSSSGGGTSVSNPQRIATNRKRTIKAYSRGRVSNPQRIATNLTLMT